MTDSIMIAGTVVFFVLFSFLIFIFGVFILSTRKRQQHLKTHLPKVTVVIPTYNEEKNIGACLGSILASDYKDMYVIVVDDGSTDRTRDIVKKFSNITLLQQDHKGKVDALNLGLAHARGECLVSIDADTIVEPDFIKEIVKPFQDKKVAATSGVVLVENKYSFSGAFQNIEYHYNNLIRQAFSRVFDTGIWFFGCLAAYRITTLRQVGGFKKDTLTEDMDIAMECKDAGYKTINVTAAKGYTRVPTTLKGLFMQRSRWWVGGLQSLRKNKKMFSHKSSPSILFLFINHYWWAVYAFLSLPLIIYQVNFWFPHTTAGEAALYLIRWFTLWGPFYVLYKIPEWGLNILNIFGVLSGVISLIMIIAAIKMFNDRLTLKNVMAIILYFPYTIILNLIMAGSVIRSFIMKQQHFVKP